MFLKLWSKAEFMLFYSCSALSYFLLVFTFWKGTGEENVIEVGTAFCLRKRPCDEFSQKGFMCNREDWWKKGCLKLCSFWSSDWNIIFHSNFWLKAWHWKFYNGQSFAGLCSVLLEWSSYFINTCTHLLQSGFHICMILSIIYISVKVMSSPYSLNIIRSTSIQSYRSAYSKIQNVLSQTFCVWEWLITLHAWLPIQTSATLFMKLNIPCNFIYLEILLYC